MLVDKTPTPVTHVSAFDSMLDVRALDALCLAGHHLRGCTSVQLHQICGGQVSMPVQAPGTHHCTISLHLKLLSFYFL